MKNDHTTEETVLSREVFSTNDYSKFKTLPGNRAVDEIHVGDLKKKITTYGNLTPHFPIVVNESMQVIDGQHRLKALKELEWDVYYVIQPNMTIDEVRAINLGMRNWSWEDYAKSYASLGNQTYRDFIKYMEIYKFPFRTYLHAFNAAHQTNLFKTGKLEIQPHEWSQGIVYLNQLQDCLTVIEISHTQTLRLALISLFKSPNYDHKRMVAKLENFGNHLKEWNTQTDFMRNLEDIYNHKQTEANISRLF